MWISNFSFLRRQPVYTTAAKIARYIDLTRLPVELGGTLKYCHTTWVNTRKVSCIWTALTLFIWYGKIQVLFLVNVLVIFSNLFILNNWLDDFETLPKIPTRLNFFYNCTYIILKFTQCKQFIICSMKCIAFVSRMSNLWRNVSGRIVTWRRCRRSWGARSRLLQRAPCVSSYRHRHPPTPLPPPARPTYSS